MPRKHPHYLFLLLVLCIAIIAVVLYRSERVPVAPPTWTAENSLVQEASWPQFVDDLSLNELASTIKHSLSYYGKIDPNTSLKFGNATVRAQEMVDSFNKLLKMLEANPSTDVLNIYLQNNFTLYRSAAPEVLFTGYYLPRLQGSLVQTDRYTYPMYAVPSDLVELSLDPSLKSKLPADFPVMNRGRIEGRRVVIPYYSREEIDTQGKLDGKRLEILWVDDIVDLFFLHIQGSGFIDLPDGSTVRVGYADKNGQPYRAIGKTLLERGYLEKGSITMYTIKDVLKKNPQIITEVLNSNPSYVFFKLLEGDAVGSLNVPVTALRSIAVDQSIFPKGALALISTEKPIFSESGEVTGWAPFTRIALNQDTGGAIRGAGRVDIFMGAGKNAEASAAVMQQKGSLFFLAPK